jgi:hypothetical protein
LVKWFWAIFLVSTDKRGFSALALSRKIDIGLKCAWTMLHKIRKAMETRDAEYQLAGLIQVDDAVFKGGVNKGGDKRGRGTSKVPVIVMAAVKDEAITFAKMEVVGDVNGDASSRPWRNVSPLAKPSVPMDFLPITSSRTSDWSMTSKLSTPRKALHGMTY